MAQSIGTVLIDVQANTQKLVDGFDKAEKKVGKATDTMKKTILGLTTAYLSLEGVNAFTGMIKGSIDAADSLSELAEKLNISVSSLSELEYISGFAGVSIGQLNAAMSAMIRRTGNFKADGTGAAVKALTELGLSVEYARENFTDTETTFDILIDRLRGVEDGTLRTKLAQDLFSKSASDVVRLANMSAKEIRQLGDEGHRTGAIFTDEFASQSAIVNDAIDRVSLSITGLKNNLASDLAPTIIDVADGISENLPLIIDVAKEITHLAITLGTTTLAFKAYSAISNNFNTTKENMIKNTKSYKKLLKEETEARRLGTQAIKANAIAEVASREKIRKTRLGNVKLTKKQISALKQEASSLQTAALAQTQKTYAMRAGIKQLSLSTIATRAFSTALRATPFGIATTAIYFLSDAFMDNSDKAKILEDAYSNMSDKLKGLTKNQLEYRKSLIETELIQARLDLANAKAAAGSSGSKEELAYVDKVRKKFNNLTKTSREIKKALRGTFSLDTTVENKNNTQTHTNTPATTTKKVLESSVNDIQKYFETIGDYQTSWMIEYGKLSEKFVALNDAQFKKAIEVAKVEYFDKLKDDSLFDDVFETVDAQFDELDKLYEKKAEVKKEFQDTYLKSILSNSDYEKKQLDEQYKYYKKHVENKEQLQKWYDKEYKKILANRTAIEKTWQEGATSALDDYMKTSNDVFTQSQNLVSNAFYNMENSLVDFVTTGKASFSDFVDGILEDVARLVIRQQITAPLASAISSIDFGTLFSAHGNAFSDSGVEAFATGGTFTNSVVTNPTMFEFGGGFNTNLGVMGEAGPEAILPLSRIGKDLGVKTTPSNVVVNVINKTTQDVSAKKVSEKLAVNKNGEAERILDVVIYGAQTNKNNFRNNLKGFL